ncbi:hypothetical protein O3P69_012874 [Scylla paramamosain]|uniref:Glycolipid transfer protein domain-containing protein n=1 Tax=Scylla paramamosain TaxID=85552 RepID=A0AAW0TTG8_SCYPA
MDSSTSEIEVVNGKLKKELVVKEKEDEEEEKKDEVKEMRNAKLLKNEKEELKVKEEEEEEEEDSDDDETEMDNEEDEEDEEEEKLKELIVDMQLVRDYFTPGAENEVPLASYLKAYVELNKFIKMLGKFYYFVSLDVKRKIATLRKKMAGENSQYYVDLKTMIKYETENGLVVEKSMSGTEALLMLHRGLEFARDFMTELVKEKEEPKLSEAASRIYVSTTGRFHPPILRETFSLVLRMLPNRATIRSRVAKENEEAEETLKRLLPEVIKSVTETYDVCQRIYQDYNLLNLP